MSRLVVPILVDALRVKAAAAVLAPPRFSELPYLGTDDDGNPVDVNVGQPFLAETTHNTAFSPPGFMLGAGVHLHWILPRALRTTRTDGEGTQFPAAPDQWLVVRRRAAAGVWNIERAWRVDAAFVWPEDAPEGVPFGIVVDDGDAFLRRGSVWPWGVREEADGSPRYSPESGGAPWRFVGATWEVHQAATDWCTETAPDADPGSTRLPPGGVTASGWGDPGYAGFYPGCVGQFGLFDEGTDDAASPDARDPAGQEADVEYVVFGWYSDGSVDPLRTFLTSCGTTDPVERKRRLARQLGLDVDGDIPQDMLLVGRVSNRNFLRPAQDRTPPSYEVAIGGSGTHALAAVLTAEITRDSDLASVPPAAHTERQLDALLFAKHLHGPAVDVGARLDELVSRRLFRTKSGGQRGVIRGRPPPDAPADLTASTPVRPSPRPDENVELPDEVATDLDAFNEAQASVEAAARLAADLRHQLYSDWHRAILHTDPSCALATDWILADETDGAVNADAIYGLARRRLTALVDALALRAQKEDDRDALGVRIEIAVAAHNERPGAPQWSLDAVPAPPFFAPNEPAIALVPTGDAPHRTRWKGAGLTVTEAGALCTRRTNLLPDDAAGVNQILADAAGLVFDPAVADDETPPLRMDWQVQIATEGGNDPGGGYTADWLGAAHRALDATLALSGSALLTDDATPVLTAALRSYIRERLRNDPVDFAQPTGTEWVHPLGPAATTATRSTWLTRAALPNDSDQELDGWLQANAVTVREWSLASALVCQLDEAARDQAAWAKAKRPPGFPRSGKLVDAAGAAAAAHLPVGDLVTALRADPSTNRLRAYELAAAEAGGVPEAGFIYGVPRGGNLAKSITELANTLNEDTLRTLLDDDAVTAAIAEERPFDDLADLARLPEMSAVFVGGFVRQFEDTVPVTLGCANPSSVESTARIDPLATALAAWVELQKRGPALVHTLDGLNDALLQWDAAPQLPMEDPTGFQDHRDFLDQALRPAVHRSRRRAPRQDFPFVPLRSGQLKLTRLRLVDSFGGVVDIPTGTVATPTSWRSPNADLPVRMPPRLVQPSRLQAAWLDGADPTRKWTPHPGRTPVCGWFVLDSFAGQLDVHDADGAPLGGMDDEGVWRVAPGRRAPTTLAMIPNPVLAMLAQKISVEVGVLPFTDAVDRALEDIHSASSADDQALSLLLSRPLAVVQLKLEWEAAEPLARRQDAAGLVRELVGQIDTRAVGGVELPVQVGARHRLTDGVVAWCEVTETGLGPLQLPHQGATKTSVTLDGCRAPTLLLIVDPSAEVHLLTELLPPTVVRLPAFALAEAARAHELLTYSGPHLTPRTGLRAPQLQESGWTATMVLPEPGRWVELTDTPLVERRAFEARLDAASGIWDRLHLDGILVAVPDEPGLARLAPPPASAATALPAAGAAKPTSLEEQLAAYPSAAQVVAALAITGRAYTTPAHDLSFAPLELREAFLHLRNNDQ